MKKNKAFYLLILSFLLCSMVYAQTSVNHNSVRSNRSQQVVETGKPFNLSLLLGAGTSFGLPSNSSTVIPKLGLDFNFGKFGLRASGQFFKTSPDFDIDDYLSPISSHVTQTGEDQHSNIQIGINPYLNFAQKTFSIQAGLGLNYFMQTGADLQVNYPNHPPGAIFDSSEGDLKRNTFVLDPNIRAIIGKPNKALTFFVEAGYAIPMGKKEYTYTSRDLTDVVLPDGGINPDLIKIAKTITHTEKLIPASPWIGIGLELHLTARPKGNNDLSSTDDFDVLFNDPVKIQSQDPPERGGWVPETLDWDLFTGPAKIRLYNHIIDNYDPNDGIPDAIIQGPQGLTEKAETGKTGGKYVGSTAHFAMSPGEPVPGAEVFLELEPDEEPISTTGTTDNEGSSKFKGKPQLVSQVKGKGVSYKMHVNIPKGIYASKLKESNVGLVAFNYTLETNKGAIVYKILAGGDTHDPGITMVEMLRLYQGATTGPYDVGLSNIEDNIINIELPLDNIYGLKLIGGTLTGSSITMHESDAYSDYIINNYDPNNGIPDATIPGPQGLIKQEGDNIASPIMQFAMSPGEPVPGAEVFLELEPDEEPISTTGTTDNEGSSKFKGKPQLVSQVKGKDVSYKMHVNIPKGIYASKLKESNVGFGEFNYTLETNQGDIVYKILVSGNNDNPNITITKVWQIYQGATTGPYDVGLSNIEDNIINIELPLDNVYGLKLIGGTLTCSSISMEDGRNPQTGKEIQIPAKKVVR